MHHETVSKYIAQLESLNLIKKTIGTGKSWDFEIIRPSDWAGHDSIDDTIEKARVANPKITPRDLIA